MLRGKAWPVWIFVLLNALAAYGGEDLAGRNVVEIQYEPREQPADQRDLAKNQLLKVGTPLDLRQVAATIDRLYATGLYQDIKAYGQPAAGGAVVKFVTIPNRFIGHVDVRGKVKDPPSRSVILGEAQLSLGKQFDADMVEEARQRIEKQMRLNGLFNGTVTATTTDDPATHQVSIGFIVSAGKRVRYELPEITGDTKLADKTIVAATGWRIPVMKRWRQVSRSLTDKGVDGIEKRYAKKDRLTATVDLTSVDYDEASSRALAHLDIDGGPKIAIHALEAKVSRRTLLKYVPVYEEGSIDDDLLTEGARNLRDYFEARGYPDVDITFSRQPVKDDQQVVNYYIVTGPRRRLVHVEIAGNSYFARRIYERECFCGQTPCLLRYGRYSEGFRKQDEEALTSLYRPTVFVLSKFLQPFKPATRERKAI